MHENIYRIALISILTLAASAALAPAQTIMSDMALLNRAISHSQYDSNTGEKVALSAVTVPAEKIDLGFGRPVFDAGAPARRLNDALSSRSFFTKGTTGIKFSAPSGKLIAAVTSVRGVLDGPVIAFADDATQIVCTAVYSHGDSNGELLAFDDKANPVLFGRWRNAKRDGQFFGFNLKGNLELAAEYKDDKLQSAYGVSIGAVVERLNADGSVPFGGPLAHGLGRLDERIKEIKQKERALKKLVAAADEESRRQVAAANSVAKRNAIIDRGASDSTQTIQQLFRWQNSFGASQGR